MKKVLTVFVILLMVYSMNVCNAFPSDFRTVTTTSSPTTTCPACDYYCRDADEDGYGDPSTRQFAPIPPPGYVLDCTDCNDTNPGVNPGAIDWCSRFEIDDNCNGLVDDVCPADSPLGCISGIVIRGPSGEPSPLPMLVELERIRPRPKVKMWATTDSSGCYSFTNLEDGKYKITLMGCESRGSRRKRMVVITGGGKINNKDIGWWRNSRLTRCFYSIR